MSLRSDCFISTTELKAIPSSEFLYSVSCILLYRLHAKLTVLDLA